MSYTNSERNSIVNSCKNWSQFFAIDLVIKVFGIKIFEFHYPPQKEI